MGQLKIHLLPGTTGERLEGQTAAVIDVLRASTTIVTALAHGAEQVIPVADVGRARAIAQQGDTTNVLLGGERGGAMIAGFDLDNSPCNYLPRLVLGKRIVFTTSHGTRAIAWASGAARLLIASFANLSSAVRELASTRGDIHLVCSGTDGAPCIEDALCAAVIAGQVWRGRGKPPWRDDTTLMLLELYQQGTWRDDVERLRLLSSGRGGQRLTRLGFQRDIAFAAQLDRFQVVPRLVKGLVAHLVANESTGA